MNLSFKSIVVVVTGSLFCLWIGAGNLNAQIPEGGLDEDYVSKRERIKARTEETLEKLFEYAWERNYKAFSKLMVYNGPNPNRQLNDMINYNDPFERLDVENTVNLIRHWMKKSEMHKIRNFRVAEGVGKKKLYFFDVEFFGAKGKNNMHKFCFVDYNDKFLFCEARK